MKYYQAIALSVILAATMSCRSNKQLTERVQVATGQAVDSVHASTKITTRPVFVPQDRAAMHLDIDDLLALPNGASFRAHDGRATADITKTETGYKITANCDSLTLLVTDLEREVYRLQKEKTELETKTQETITIEVNRLSGWQSFQIYGFWICISIILLYTGYRQIKNKLKILK